VEKHLLVTVSEHKSAMYGLRFVSAFFQRKDQMRLTVLYLLPRPPKVWEEEKSYETLSEAERQAAKHLAVGRKAATHAKNELARGGFDAEHIETKLQERRGSKAYDIIAEGERGLYDAVVLGRRGLSMLEEVVDESTTHEAMGMERGFPLYICRRPEYDRKGVLLCVDGSGASLRMADHVGFMLADEDTHHITLLSVDNGAGDPQAHLAAAQSALAANGVADSRMTGVTVQAKQPHAAILDYAQETKPAVVAAGGTGAGRGLKSRLFMGSVSAKLMRDLTGAALWVMR